MKKVGYKKRTFTEGPYPLPHSIDGEQMPPDGTKQPDCDDRGMMTSKPIGVSYPDGQDFGPFVHHIAEGLFHSFNLDFTHTIPYSAGGVHPHTGILLFALALNVHPDVIIETGTFYGYSTLFLAKACEIWGKGKVYSFDPEDKLIAPEIMDHPYVECIKARSDKGALQNLLDEVKQVDFALIDSWKRLALYEFLLIEPYIVEGGVVVFHDTQFLNTGEELHRIIEKSFPQYDTMLFTGTPSEDDPHSYFGNADDRGLYVIRRKMEDPFQNVGDASTAEFGAKQVMPHTTYHAIDIEDSSEEEAAEEPSAGEEVGC